LTLGGQLWLSHAMASGNGQGISSTDTVYTYGDNSVAGNGADVNAALSNVSRSRASLRLRPLGVSTERFY